jgi:hypothetical protein
MQERRRSTRQRSYLGGKMVFNTRNTIVDCLVRNFTDGGAKVECPPFVMLPQDVDLTIESKGVQARARVIWRKDAQVGLAFTTGPTGVGAADNVVPIGTAHLISKLQAANADLRRRVARLSEES